MTFQPPNPYIDDRGDGIMNPDIRNIEGETIRRKAREKDDVEMVDLSITPSPPRKKQQSSVSTSPEKKDPLDDLQKEEKEGKNKTMRIMDGEEEGSEKRWGFSTTPPSVSTPRNMKRKKVLSQGTEWKSREKSTITKLIEGLSDREWVCHKESIVFHSLATKTYQKLWELRPHFIILYDLDLAFLRQIENYKACYGGRQVRVYFLCYEGSVEEQRYG